MKQNKFRGSTTPSVKKATVRPLRRYFGRIQHIEHISMGILLRR